MNILELFAHIGLKADQGAADGFLKSVNGIKGGLVGAIAGTLSLAAAVKIVNQSFADTLALKKFEQDTGMASDAMQRWKAVADQVNGSGGSVADTLRAISTNQEKIKLGQGNISGYQLLGIDPRADPIEVLEKFRAKTQNVSQAMRRNLASQLGISSDLVATLELSNAQFDKMAQDAWVIPSSSIESVNKARASISALTNMLTYLKTELTAKFAPIIVKTVDMIIRAARMLDIIVKGSIGWKNAIIGISAALAIMNAGFLLSPIGLFTAGIVLLMAVLEDLYVYSKGGDSLIGDLAEGFPELKKILDSTFGVFKDVGAAIQAILEGDWAKFDKILEKWGAFGKIIDGIVRGIAYLAGQLNGGFAGALGEYTETAKKEGIGQAISNDWGKFLGELQAIGSWMTGSPQTPALAGAAIPVGKAPGSTNNTNTNNISISVDGAASPNATAAAVNERIQAEMQKTYNQSTGSKKEK